MALADGAILQRFRTALTKSKSNIHRLLQRIKELTAPPHVYAAVVSVKVHPAAASTEAIPEVGARVRILASIQFSSHVGQLGFVVSEPDDQGQVLVIFDDGSRGFFGVGLAATANPAREIESAYAGQKVAVVALDSRLIELPFPAALKLEAGDTVTIAQKSMAIVGVVSDRDIGEIAVVRKLVNDSRCEIAYHDQVRVISTGRYGAKLQVGDRVVIDPSVSVILFSFGGTDDSRQVKSETGVSWDDIGGLVEAKRLIRQAIVGPIEDAKLYAAYQRPRSKGSLVFGPPGVGKTMLLKAAYTELVKLYGQKYVPSGFIYVKGPELLRSLVGGGEAELRQVFAQGRKHFQLYGYPCLIFFDEADAFLKKRGTGVSSDVNDTMVDTFLTETDGLDESGGYIVLATNRQDVLDPAATRDGRIDDKIEIPRPDRTSTEAILRIYLLRTKMAEGHTVESLAALTTNEMFDPKYSLYQVHLRGAQEGQTRMFGLTDLSSGAMIRGVVNKAIDLAIDRDRASGIPVGITPENLSAAVASIFAQNLRLNHADALKDSVRDVPDEELGRVTKLRQKNS